jgi:hypothetical protein
VRFRGLVHIARTFPKKSRNMNEKKLITILIQAYSLSYLLSGGGDYRGIYDIGFKRGFMGYIGLLLNAPYKRIV